MNVHNVVIEIINVYYSVYCTLIYKYKFQLAITENVVQYNTRKKILNKTDQHYSTFSGEYIY